MSQPRLKEGQYYQPMLYSCTTAIFLWSSSNPVSSWVRKHRWSYTETPTQVLTWAPGFSIPCIDFVLSDKISRQMGVRLEIRGEVYDTSPHLDTELQVSLYQGEKRLSALTKYKHNWFKSCSFSNFYSLIVLSQMFVEMNCLLE